MTILVVGASGVNGYAVTQYFKSQTAYDVLTLSRGELFYEHDQDKHLKVDLLKPGSYAHYSHLLKEVEYIFYAALKPSADPRTEADENETMLRNCILLVSSFSDKLKHVTFLQGGKVYGAHLGFYKTPAVEDQTRHFPPNLYFSQEDYLKELSAKTAITYTALRPDVVIGYSLRSAMNLGNLIGVYATICKETGMDFIFPGSPQAFEVLVNVTDSDLVASAVEWSFNSPEAQNQAFNITNGDVFRWKDVWQELADFFGLKVGFAQPLPIQTYFDANEGTWQRIVEKYHLKDLKISDIAKGDFGDFIFNVNSDAIFNVNKARRSGFSVMNRESGGSLVKHMENLQKLQIIPTW